jgi:acetyl-CoA synthetase (ADP-forming)
VDLGGRAVPGNVEIAGDCTRILFADPAVDYGIGFLMSMPFYLKRTVAIAEAARECGKPVLLVCTPGAAADPARAELRKAGWVVYDSFEQSLRVLSLVAEYDRLRGETRKARAQRPADLPDPADLQGLREGPLSEREVKRLLASYGVAVARERIADSPAAAADAATEIGFPVVLKAVSRDIVHKSDVGAVRVGLADRAAVIDAAEEMGRRLRTRLPEARLEGFSVQEMVTGEAEVIVGVRRDPQYGAVVVVGLGGVAVEILNDVAVATAPIAAPRVRAMISGLRTAPLFSGARGKPPLDVAAVAEVVERVSWLADDLGPRLVDLEINPLIVRREGAGAVAVDGRGTFAEATT